LVKLLVPETGSDEAHAAYAKASSILCVSIGYVEATSALARMRRGERVTSGQLREKQEILEHLWRSASVHAMSQVLIDSAAQVGREDALRAYDAVHLAAAVSFAQSGALEFACWDRELREAAKKRGFTLVPESI
jgi:uncharacterized protein